MKTIMRILNYWFNKYTLKKVPYSRNPVSCMLNSLQRTLSITCQNYNLNLSSEFFIIKNASFKNNI